MSGRSETSGQPMVGCDQAVVAENLTRHFGPVAAIDGASFTVERGEFVAIEGPSGSGKSTLLNLIGGLEPPTSGRIEVAGRDLAAMGERERTIFRRQRIGVIFQLYDLLPTLNAWQNVAVPGLLDGGGLRALRPTAEGLLERVGLADRRRHRPAELSGGEQQRVAIARSMMNNPDLILADEPTGALDSVTGDEILGVLVSLVADGHTVLLVTHEPRAAAFANRSIRLLDGSVASSATPGFVSRSAIDR